MSKVEVNGNVFDSVAIWIDDKHVVNVQTDIHSAKSIGEGLAKLSEPERTETALMIRDVLWREVNTNAREKHYD